MTDHTVIVGAGIAGLTVAWLLARRGVRVSVLDRRQPGRGASWAAAGYLRHSPPRMPIADLAAQALALWPEHAALIEAESGRTVDYAVDGALYVARAGEDGFLAKTLRERAALPERLERLSAREAQQIEPALGSGVVGGVWSPDTGRVDPRRLVDALLVCLAQLGVEIQPDAPVRRVLLRGGAAGGVWLADERRINADRVVLCAGAWGGAPGFGITGAAVDAADRVGPSAWWHPPTQPVRGQIVALAPAGGGSWLRRPLFQPGDRYVVPRVDGRVVIGSTREHVGFHGAADPDVTRRLLDDAARSVPCAATLPTEAVWTGVRPVMGDKRPAIGGTEVPGLYLASGLGPQGIKLSPAVAHMLVGEMLDGAVPAAMERFRATRFRGGNTFMDD